MAFLLALMLGVVLSEAGGLEPTVESKGAAQNSGGYARPELLVDTAWLAQHLTDANVRIVDMRARGYADGHVPEAVFLDSNWIRNPKAPPTFLPTPQEFEALMSKLGISNDTRVIAYDERGGIYAARLWWILNY
jgi:thiosulfate/3-mercaptopyruvate sulfurtransferase